jgi:hypothetical protein
MQDFASSAPRPYARRVVALVVITVATAVALGVALRQPTFMGANDISRWCTVWSLLERGSYIIDECPWQLDTQDKVFRAARAMDGPSPGTPAVKHYYSSKPALLPTVIAGLLYPARKLTGIPLDRVVLEERAERWVQKPDPTSPYKVKGVLEKPAEPVRWPVYVLYFKPILILLNVIPFFVFLVLFTRVLDRYAASDWAWVFSLVAAAFGTYLLPFTQTLNNHAVAAFSAFFALYQFVRIWDEEERAGWRFFVAGFFAAFAAANELPAAAFLALVACVLFVRFPLKVLLFLVPAAAIPLAAFCAAQYAVFGELRLAYEAFGTDEYLYEGSLWKTPLDLDALNVHPEPYGVYLFHMTLGHHGWLSLTPIFLFSVWGAVRLLGSQNRYFTVSIWLSIGALTCLAGYYFQDPAAWKPGGTLHAYRWLLYGLVALFALAGPVVLASRRTEPLVALAWLTTVLTLVLLEFYTFNPMARNYGGSTQGLRWLFWLIPFWLMLLPQGVAKDLRGRPGDAACDDFSLTSLPEGADKGHDRPWLRVLALVALGISALSAGYAMRNPWSHPWILDAIEHLGLYSLAR